MDEYLTHWGRIDHLNFGQALFIHDELFEAGGINIADCQFSIHVEHTNLVFRNKDGSKSIVTSFL